MVVSKAVRDRQGNGIYTRYKGDLGMANVSGMIVAELKRRRAKLEEAIAGIDAAIAIFTTPNSGGGSKPKAAGNKAASAAMKESWRKRKEKAAAAKADPAASLTEVAS